MLTLIQHIGRRARRGVKGLFTVVFFVVLLLYNYASDGALVDLARPFASDVPDEPPGTWDDHPVVRLHRDAKRRFDALVARQSRNIPDAEAEYRRRYARDPPPGFARWVEYAFAHRSPIIDDFDVIAEGVHPFLKYSAAELRQRVSIAQAKHINNYIDLCSFSDGRFGPGCRKFAEPLTKMLGGAASLAPNINDFLINLQDEPSVLLAPGGSSKDASISWTNIAQKSIIGPLSEACQVRGTNMTSQPPSQQPAFVEDWEAQKDLCQHPEYEKQHGFVASPSTLARLSTEVPLLTWAKPYPFSDVIFPPTIYEYPTSHNILSRLTDRLWAFKTNTAYWAGSPTGGSWSLETWQYGHRQRLVALATGRDGRQFTFLRPGPSGGLEAYKTTVGGMKPLFDVTLTRFKGREAQTDAVVRAMSDFFGGPAPYARESRALRHRYPLDIDGHTLSKRFYRQLASHCAPLRMTLFREWHDDRLVPWLHYFPFSVAMDELPELVRFLTSTAEGQRVGKAVAEAGRRWHDAAMTLEHRGVYLYRLMLEIARLQDDARVPEPR